MIDRYQWIFFNNKTIMKQITFLYRKNKYVRLLFGRHFAKKILTHFLIN